MNCFHSSFDAAVSSPNGASLALSPRAVRCSVISMTIDLASHRGDRRPGRSPRAPFGSGGRRPPAGNRASTRRPRGAGNTAAAATSARELRSRRAPLQTPPGRDRRRNHLGGFRCLSIDCYCKAIQQRLKAELKQVIETKLISGIKMADQGGEGRIAARRDKA
jgi:hypothetical protein